MTMTSKQELQKVKLAIHEFALFFIKKYFSDVNPSFYWISEEVGGVLCVNDYFFDLNEMREFVRYDYSEKEMFKYKDFKLSNAMLKSKRKTIPNIEEWKKLNPK